MVVSVECACQDIHLENDQVHAMTKKTSMFSYMNDGHSLGRATAGSISHAPLSRRYDAEYETAMAQGHQHLG